MAKYNKVETPDVTTLLYFATFSTNFIVVDRRGVRSDVTTLLYFAIFSTNFTVVDRRGVRSGVSTLLYFAIFSTNFTGKVCTENGKI
jgi:hypothetical protein